MDHNWDLTPRPQNKRLHSYRFRPTHSVQGESPMEWSHPSDYGGEDISTFHQEQLHVVRPSPDVSKSEGGHSEVCPPKRLRLDPTSSVTTSHAERSSKYSTLEQYHMQKANEVKAMKALFRESGFLPVPDSTDMVYLTMELKRRQYCQKHDLKYNPIRHEPSAETAKSDVPMNKGSTKRHSFPPSEDDKIPRKFRVLHSGSI